MFYSTSTTLASLIIGEARVANALQKTLFHQASPKGRLLNFICMTLPKVAEIKVSYQPAISDRPVMQSSLDAFNFFKGFYMGETICLQEQFSVMYLNRMNRVLGVYIISKGGMTGTVVDIRLILAVALKTAATSIMLCHNHPSGNVKPSHADIGSLPK